ncbi:hypothetical protein [Roseiconus lacunae]|uniref:hypothetical protein n=1 Tax=Roseiconus lacunae TaxID=2605694 RepID=UPI00135AF30A|nr:hypothetical protein [Roseiconus lacunae]
MSLILIHMRHIRVFAADAPNDAEIRSGQLVLVLCRKCEHQHVELADDLATEGGKCPKCEGDSYKDVIIYKERAELLSRAPSPIKFFIDDIEIGDPRVGELRLYSCKICGSSFLEVVELHEQQNSACPKCANAEYAETRIRDTLLFHLCIPGNGS